MNPQRLLDRIRRGHLRNLGFDDFTSLLDALGFGFTRTRGSHHLYRHEAVQEMLVVQPSKSGDAKPYQIRQLFRLIDGYSLRLEER